LLPPSTTHPYKKPTVLLHPLTQRQPYDLLNMSSGVT
jgi:hypothetical protein